MSKCQLTNYRESLSVVGICDLDRFESLMAAYIQTMTAPSYFEHLMYVSSRPGMYGVQDVMDLNAFLTGYCVGSNKPELYRLLGEFTDFLKKENPEFSESTCAWGHIIKAQSWERGGSIKLFRLSLGRMLLEHGHWTDAHFEIFTSEKTISHEALRSLPSPQYSDPPAGSDL